MAIERNNPTTMVEQIDPRLQEELPFVETEFDDGSIEFDFEEDSVNDILQEGVVNVTKEHYDNLAVDLEQGVLNEISTEVIERFEDDKASRSEWLNTVNEGLSLLGIDLEESDDPFPGACSAHHPMILEAAVKFQAKASNELFHGKGPVKTMVVGNITEEKEKQATRVRNHMNYQVTDQMEEYFDETERLLFYLPLVGSGFKKTFNSGVLDRPVSEFVPVDEFVVNYYTTNLKTASCFTHMIQRSHNDLLKDQRAGLYRDDIDFKQPVRSLEGETQIVIDETTGTFADADEEIHTLLEQYCYLHLEDDPMKDPDGIGLPYVVTVDVQTEQVLSIRRNWRENDPIQEMICPFTHYKFVPGLGFYGLGYIHLLGNLQMTLTAAMRNLVDSGTFATLQGGFIDKRLRIRSKGDGPMMPGEFKDVEAGGIALKDSIMPLPFKEPSQTLFAMFQHIEARGQKFADSTEQVVSDATNYGPVGTTMALLEASTKFFSGVHKRLHKAQKYEFKILAALNFEFLEESMTYDVVGNTFEISKEDYDGVIDVVPVSDPNIGSQAQKLTQAQGIYQGALQTRDIHNMKEVTKYYYSAIGVDDEHIDRFVPEDEKPQELDPLSDIVAAQQGKPIAAFPGQDHDAHIQIKTAFLQDPSAGANPAMAMVAPLIQSNIQEHMVMKFKEAVAGTVASAPEGTPTDAVVAQAAQQVAQTNQRLAELEAVGPDEARNKLADAEVQRVINESHKLEAEIADKNYERMHDAMKLELDKYKTDLDFIKTQLQESNKTNAAQMKEMSDLIKNAMTINKAAENPVDNEKEE